MIYDIYRVLKYKKKPRINSHVLYQYLGNYRIVQDGTDMIYKQMLNISIINKSNECCIPKCTLRSAIARSDLLFEQHLHTWTWAFWLP